MGYFFSWAFGFGVPATESLDTVFLSAGEPLTAGAVFG
jgi:hypothetical protein